MACSFRPADKGPGLKLRVAVKASKYRQRVASMSSMFMPERFKEYHRTLRQKRSEELSMKQVAGSFGGLYAVIHLLQYFDIWTLLLLMVGAYFIYRQIVDNWSKVWLAFNQDTTEPVSNQTQTASKAPKSKGKRGQGRTD